MNVLFVHDGPLFKDSSSDYYGIAHNNEVFQRYYTIADELTVIMRKRNFNSEEDKKNYSKITIEPFEFIDAPNISSLKGQVINKKEALQIITKEVKSTDYVVARIPSLLGNIAVNVAKKLKKPYLIELVTCPWDSLWNHSLKGKIIAPYMYYHTKSVVKDAPYVVYVTNKFLQNRYPTKGKNTNCSNVALSDFKKDTLKRRVNKINSIDKQESIIIGTTAAIDVKFKGQKYIIKALGKLKQQGITKYEYHLVGAGDPSYLSEIAKRYNVEEQVKFLGPLKHHEVFNWLEEIDIYTQPSKQEGLPRALIEAMSRAVPSFGAKTAGIPELIESDYIFNHGINSTSIISDLILSFDKKTMLKQAERNYKESMKYDKDIIESRRRKFLKEFVSSKEENQ